MGLYNVVAPCVVGKLHYARPTTAPIEVDDKVAAPLVEAGKLESISAEPVGKIVDEPVGEPAECAPPGALSELLGGEPAPEKPAPRSRGRRRSSED